MRRAIRTTFHYRYYRYVRMIGKQPGNRIPHKKLDIYLPVLLHFRHAHLITPQRSTAQIIAFVAILIFVQLLLPLKSSVRLM